jgi:tetratricopeptide (TPR) repeat protein
MKYEDYADTCKRAGALFESGHTGRALAMFEDLIASDISALDKAIMCHNAATALDRLGRPQEALQAYDRAIAYEAPFSRCDSMERKAVFLAGRNETRASIALYEQMLLRPYATEHEKERFRVNIETLRQRLP